MKKIFAIALALVMVLSMASAFALTCNTNFDWNCATTTYTCGKIKLEIVPFVRSTTACVGESQFTANNCAASIIGERVYYGIKMTVDKDLDKEWYESIKNVMVKQTNLSGTEGGNPEKEWNLGMPVFDAINNDGKGGVYWMDAKTGAWDKDADFDNDNVQVKWALKSNVKVCIEGKAKNEFNGAAIGDWNVSYDEAGKVLKFVKKGGKLVHIKMDDDTDKVVRAWGSLDNGASGITFVSMDNGMLVDAQGNRYGTSCNEAALVMEVMNFFKFSFNTCITKKAINMNFGWENDLGTCFTWGKNGTAIVNPECKVEIPKTGDASVVAYAVMALVAAAGAMGLKK